MPDYDYESSVSRRRFLRNVTLTAVAATAVGAGAAGLVGREKTAVINTNPTNLPPLPAAQTAQTAQTIITAPNDAADVIARLASAEAENVRLQAALDAANRELESLRTSSADATADTQNLSLQLQDATAQVGVLAGLVSLYEQLDGIDVGDWIQDGLTAVGDGFGELFNITPELTTGITNGERALAEIEAHIPLLENGRAWLDEQVTRVGGAYTTLEYILQEVVESVGDLLEMIQRWFEGVRKWLPFGIGENAARVVAAFSDLVSETPNTISGLSGNVAQPLDVWLAREADDQPRLQHTLVRPLREQVLTRATTAVTQAEQVHAAFRDRVTVPAETAVASRQAVRDQIAAYREQHQI